MSPFPYNKVLMVGATSGIGLALSERMIENGIHVIAVGRRQENLDSFVGKHGKDKTSSVKFDITDLKGIPKFVQTVTKEHPDLSCVFLNSGVQRRLDFTKPEDMDLESVDMEFTTNYLSYVHLVKYFLPFLQASKEKTSLVFTTSGLALIPIIRCANYCASKAALHHLILCLRAQMEGSNVNVIEVLPPAVQTELHDEKHQPDIKNGRNIGMPLDEFTDEAWAGLCKGDSDIPVGMGKAAYDGWEGERQKVFYGLVQKGMGVL